MTTNTGPLTSYPKVDEVVRETLAQVRAILEYSFVGMYLEGSLANGDFDQDSDIDFVVVTGEPVSPDQFAALQAMHARLATSDSEYAVQLEGSYLSRRALHRYDPQQCLHPNLERGQGERLKMAVHDQAWDIHRHVLREKGLTVAGPDPHTLIDPISPDELRRAVLSMLDGWAVHLLEHPHEIGSRGYQSYVVLSLCRMLYTLQTGAVVSKRVAARWAQATLDEKWIPLIERAWDGRHHPQLSASPEEVRRTLEMIRYVLERGLGPLLPVDRCSRQ